MTRNEVLVAVAEGFLKDKFAEVDKGYEIIEGSLPAGYVVPQWLYDVLTILQEDKPKWHGKPVDPWAKDEIRGQ